MEKKERVGSLESIIDSLINMIQMTDRGAQNVDVFKARSKTLLNLVKARQILQAEVKNNFL